MTGAPSESLVRANGLLHHVLEWHGGPGPRPPVVLCHGFLDVGASWTNVAERVAQAGRHVIAFDWRGHGQTEWVGRGGYYHFLDYVRDLEELVRHFVGATDPIDLVGHSMGGTVAALYAGAMPLRVRRLALIEGLGPPEADPSAAPARLRAWFDGLDRARARPTKAMASLEEALARMRQQNPELPDALGLKLAERATRREGSGFVWSFDPLHRTTSPMPFMKSVFMAYLARIEAQTLLVSGERGFRSADDAERAAQIRRHERVTIADVGHMVHWMRPEELSRVLLGLFDAP